MIHVVIPCILSLFVHHLSDTCSHSLYPFFITQHNLTVHWIYYFCTHLIRAAGYKLLMCYGIYIRGYVIKRCTTPFQWSTSVKTWHRMRSWTKEQGKGQMSKQFTYQCATYQRPTNMYIWSIWEHGVYNKPLRHSSGTLNIDDGDNNVAATADGHGVNVLLNMLLQLEFAVYSLTSYSTCYCS